MTINLIPPQLRGPMHRYWWVLVAIAWGVFVVGAFFR